MKKYYKNLISKNGRNRLEHGGTMQKGQITWNEKEKKSESQGKARPNLWFC
jgi:hypothetical protein